MATEPQATKPEPQIINCPDCSVPERAQLEAQTLRATTYDQFINDVDPADLTKAEAYPLGWEE